MKRLQLGSTVAALMIVGVSGCGMPERAAATADEAINAIPGEPDTCKEYGFARSQVWPVDWLHRCSSSGPDGSGPTLQMSLYFLCRAYGDSDTPGWISRYDWYQCLNGVADPSGGKPEITTFYTCPPDQDGTPCTIHSLPDEPIEVDANSPDGLLLRALIQKISDTRAKLKSAGGATLDQQLQLVDAAALFAAVADDAFVKSYRGLAVQSVGTAWRVLDLAVNFVPGVALARDSVVVLTGRNPITGETVSDTERAMIAASLLAPAFLEGTTRSLVDLGETLEDVARSGKAEATVAGDLVGAISRSDEEVADLVHSVPCTTAARLDRPAPLASGPCGKLGEITAELAAQSEKVLTSLRKGEVGFGTAVRKDYRTTFFDSYGWELESEIGQVHHAVEQQVLTRYPGVITESEMHSLENLRGIPVGPDGVQLHQKEIRNAWEAFYKSWDDADRVPTKEDLLSFAKTLDDEFGRDFVPPIR